MYEIRSSVYTKPVKKIHLLEGWTMSKKYQSLYALMEADSEASDYYSSLPDYVREQISQRADNVNSIESLMDYAENLLRGDDWTKGFTAAW